MQAVDEVFGVEYTEQFLDNTPIGTVASDNQCIDPRIRDDLEPLHGLGKLRATSSFRCPKQIREKFRELLGISMPEDIDRVIASRGIGLHDRIEKGR